ncbi:hypothetical protein [Bacillus benzoevorans]|uniref:Magnesium-transporting ATPase (P-type) n=1 Tax=Bacillus benzoevorans TaxID=1456 RepID=A0A7X0HTU3_9BACI|nr:hypothetical protein [Bacillus benzoevorans]MBB6446723.1 magnesium-transporting ATPase (P-type) [Bacillus benzoevorans]
MVSSNLSIKQKAAGKDLYIIVGITLVTLTLFMVFNSQIMAFAKAPDESILLRTLFMAMFQFGLTGLGITVVALYRKESFLKFGLKKDHLIKAVLLSILVLIPYIIFGFATGAITTYMPFHTFFFTKELLEAGFPTSILGITIIALVWGFFEGFNYVVISDKINQRYPSKSIWLNWGAISCGIFCLLIHGMVGVTAEALTMFIMIYGMLVVKEYTGNAWGCVLIFMLFWNAIS